MGDEEAKFRDAFDQLDVLNEGRIPTRSLAGVMRRLGVEVDEEELTELMDNVDENTDGSIDIQEFSALVSKVVRDTNIKEDELQLILAVLGERVDYREVRAMI